MREKNTNIQIGSLFMSSESFMDFTKENTKFSEFNSFYWVQWWIYDWIMRSGRVIAVYAFWTKIYISLGLKPLSFTQVRMYPIFISSQASVLTVILNKTVPQRALNPYQQPMLSKATTILSIVTIKAFPFVISLISLWTISLSFTLYRI